MTSHSKENSLRIKHQQEDGACACCKQPTVLEDKYLSSTGWVCGPCADELARIETWGNLDLCNIQEESV